MAEQTTKKPRKPKSSLIGNQAKPTVLDSTTKLDIDTNKVLVDNIIEAGLNSRLDVSELERFTTISNSRDQIYQLIDTMCQDSSVSSIVRTYTEDICETADNGHIIWCESNDPNISKFVNYLLNVMNVDKQISSWVYCLIKYGDVYLRLYRESDYEDATFKKDSLNNVKESRLLTENLEESVHLNIHRGNDSYSYYIEMVSDPSTMFELTKYGQTYGYIEVPNNINNFAQTDLIGGTSGMTTNVFNYNYKTGDVNVYQADDFVHASLEDNVSRTPEVVTLFTPDSLGEDKGTEYRVKRGKSLLFDAYKIWREKALLESAALLSRITRSGIVRKVGVEVGDMPKEQVQQTIRRIKELFEQKSAYNTDKSFSEYNNPGAVDNFIYYATHNGQGAITVESVGGDYDPKQLTDLDWWNNKFYSSFGIPKQYFGWTDDATGFNGGSSLTILSSVYSKGVKRIQNLIIQMITDAISLILLNKGCKAYLNNFVLKMRAPVTQEELSYRENFTNRVQAISNVNGLFNDIESKPKRLEILKNLIASLNLGDDINVQIQNEIEDVTAAEKKAKEEEEAAKKKEEEAAKKAEEAANAENAETPVEDSTEDDLTAMPDAILGEDIKEDSKIILTEDGGIFEDIDDLPSPAEVDSDRDFTENY